MSPRQFELHRELFEHAPTNHAVRVAVDMTRVHLENRPSDFRADRRDIYFSVGHWLESLRHNLGFFANLGSRCPGARVLFNPNALDCGQPYAHAVPSLVALVADVDEKKQESFRSLPEKLDFLDAHGIRPFAVINSGGGRHVYFLLKKPESAWWDDNDRPSQARLANVRLQRFLGSDAVHSPAHIFGLPGTVNPKYDDFRRVEILSLDESARFSSAELHAALDKLRVVDEVPQSLRPPAPFPARAPPRARPAGRKKRKANALNTQHGLSFDLGKVDAGLRALIESDELGFFKSASEKEFYLAAALLRTGSAPEDVQRLIRDLALRRSKPGPLGYSASTLRCAALPRDEWVRVEVHVAGGDLRPGDGPFVRFVSEAGERLYWRGGPDAARNQVELASLAAGAQLDAARCRSASRFVEAARGRSFLVEVKVVSRPKVVLGWDEDVGERTTAMTKPKRVVRWGVPPSLQAYISEERPAEGGA